MKCEIQWSRQKPLSWDEDFTALPFTSLLQANAYARAMIETQHQRPRYGIIYINDQKAGLVQILEAGLFGNLIHALILDRGPLWFDGFGEDQHFQVFCQTLNKHFPARFGRKRRFIPEQPDTDRTRATLKETGFTQQSHNIYQTAIIDISTSKDTLRKNLKKSWKNSLKTAEKANLSIEWDFDGKLYNEFHAHYLKDRLEKNYSGLSSTLLKALAKNAIPKKDFIIGQALSKQGQELAAILIIRHGKTATYQIGWSLPQGRKTCANHLLLWEAIPMLKERG